MNQNLKEVRLLVLNVLKEGKITIDEAEKILGIFSQYESLLNEKSSGQSNAGEAFAELAREGVSKLEKFVNDFGQNIEKVAQNISHKINIKIDTEKHKLAEDKFTFKDTIEIPSEQKITKIQLENNWGGIKVVGEDRTDVLLDVEKIIWTKTKELAVDKNLSLKVDSSFEDNLLKIILPINNHEMRDIIHVELKVPKDIELDLSTTTGDLYLQKLSGSENEILLKTNSGDIEVKDSSAKFMGIITISGDISLEHIDCSLNTRSTSGKIDVEGDIHNDSKISSISANINGEVFIFDSLEVSSSSGNIGLKQHKVGTCKLLDIVTNSGNIHYKGTVPNSLKARSNSGEIKGKSILGKTALVDISTTSGDINWSTDDESSLNFQCESKSGEIFTNINTENIIHTHDTLKGTLKDGSAKLIMSSVSGDIKLHRDSFSF